MRILITGVNGFVGYSLALQLGLNHEIIGVGRSSVCRLNAIEYHQCDIAEWSDEICDEIPTVDTIIHAAASLSTDDDDSGLMVTNCMGTHNIFRFARQKNIKKMFYISSAPIIGVPMNHPITEQHPVNPVMMYHATKLAGEYFLNQLCRYGIENINLRINAPVGVEMPAKSIFPLFIKNAKEGKDIVLHGKGTRRQNYLDVRDLGTLIEYNLERSGIAGTYIVANKQTISNYELAKLCIKECGSSSRIVYSGKEDTTDEYVWDFDCSLAAKCLGYCARDGYEDTVRNMTRYYKVG